MKQLFVLLFSGWMGISFGQQESQIPWSQEVRLTWADFKGKPTSDDAAATTASGISYRFSTNTWGNQVEIEFVVTTHFYPDKSWYRPELCDAQILRHEQLHFDISEVFARKMRTRLAATKFTKDVKAEVAKIYDEINMALYAFQNRYDNETNFSRHREKQSEWNQKIADILKD